MHDELLDVLALLLQEEEPTQNARALSTQVCKTIKGQPTHAWNNSHLLCSDKIHLINGMVLLPHNHKVQDRRHLSSERLWIWLVPVPM